MKWFQIVPATFSFLLAAQDVHDLQPAIDNAIDRGVDWLLKHQLRDGSWGYHTDVYATGQTALSAYTLMKSGLPVTHSAVRRALLFLEPHRPIETYSSGCCLMALAATGDPAYHGKMQQLLDDLVSWQEGSWGYPYGEKDGTWDPRMRSLRDLSNTQYAALGLKAAEKVGLKIRDEVWIKLAEETLRYQERIEDVALPVDKGRTGAPKQEAAGFRYRVSGPSMGSATGSMTAAGVAVLTLCQGALKKRMPKELEQKVVRAIDLGMNWLAANFAVEKNPRKPDWVFYWLYGLERVCSFRGIELLGGHPWYLDGAKFLISKQGGSGDWYDGSAEAHTCFAILFLERASAPTTGGGEHKKKSGTHAAEGGKQDVDMRGQGGTDSSTLALWITGFSPHAKDRLAGRDGAPVRGLRVAKVEYLCDDEVVATVAGDPSRGWTTNDQFTARHELTMRGKHRIAVRVTIVDPDAPKGASEPCEVIENKGFVVDASQVHEAWMDDAARAWSKNLMRSVTATASASTTNSEGQKPERAIDEREATSWYCTKDDKAPWITVMLDRAVKADTLVLTQPDGSEHERGKHDRTTKVRVRINGSKTPFESVLPDDELMPAAIPLGSALPVKKIEIEILERVKGSAWPGNAGFAEIALENRAKERR